MIKLSVTVALILKKLGKRLKLERQAT